MNALEYAINMELDGEKFYKEQAEINKSSCLHDVCLILANDEKLHAQILRNKMQKLSYELVETNTPLSAKKIFEDIGDLKSETEKTPKQIDFYKMALDKEKQSIDIYSELLLKATDNHDKELFEYLTRQEKQHFEIIEELVALLSRTEDWVESAEFGIVEEY